MRAPVVVGLFVLVSCAGACGSSTNSATPDTAAAYRPDGTKFCALLRQDSAALEATDVSGTPAQLKQKFEKSLSVINEAKAVVPNSIRTDFDTFASALASFDHALAAANYSLQQLSPTVLQTLTSPSVTAAVDRIGPYATQVCKIP